MKTMYTVKAAGKVYTIDNAMITAQYIDTARQLGILEGAKKFTEKSVCIYDLKEKEFVRDIEVDNASTWVNGESIERFYFKGNDIRYSIILYKGPDANDKLMEYFDSPWKRTSARI